MKTRQTRTGGDLIYADPHGGKRPAGKRRGLKVLTAALAAASLMVVTIAALSFTIQGRGERYQKALTLLDRAEYAAASEELQKLDGFRDSGDLLEKLEIYTAALALMEQAQAEDAGHASRSIPETDPEELLETWEKAAGMLESLGDFADAQAKASHCRLAAADLAAQEPD